jgi:haloalkane dehalogenase
MERVRTPEERFERLPDFEFNSHYREVRDPTGGDPLRMAYLDEGRVDGEVVLLLHGEPTWSFLYRFMIPGLVEANHRVVVPDMIGFGSSDKPSRRDDYTFARQVEWTRELLFDHLDLTNVTFFGQDWGSLVGLRLVGEHPERFSRVAIGNGGLPTGAERISEAFINWQEFSQRAEMLPIGAIVSGGCTQRLSTAVVAGYDAPFPDESYKEGARQYPKLVPTSVDDPAHEANVAAWAALARWTKPFLCCFSDGDPITRGADKKFLETIPGTKGQPHTTIVGAGHFLQEEKGAELATVINAFMASD